MSQPPIQEIVAQYEADLVSTYISWSLIALVAYEHLITVKEEVSTIWSQKWTVISTWLFIANRYEVDHCYHYLHEITYSMVLASKSCYRTAVLFDIIQIAPYIVFAMFSVIRVYALSACHKRSLSILVLALNVVPIVTNILLSANQTAIYVQVPITSVGGACESLPNYSTSAISNFTLATRLALITADIIVLAVTWSRTYRDCRVVSEAGVEDSLCSLILRDGTIYFVALLGMNIANIVINSIHLEALYDPVSEIISILTPVLINRSIMDLKKAGNEPHFSLQSLTSIRFNKISHSTMRSIIGNMGETLHFGSREDLQFEEIEMSNGARDTGSNAHISRQHSVVTQRQEGEAIQEVTRGCAV